MLQENIPKLEWPKALSDSSLMEEMAKCHLECISKGGRTFNWDKYKNLPLRIRVAYAFLDWQGDLNEIVDHLNIVTGDLATLSERVDLPGDELWSRYRLLARTALNEFYRVKEVSDLFFKELKTLGLIDEPERQGFSLVMRDLLGKLIDVRNKITHDNMPVVEEERRALLTVMFESAGLVLVSKTTGERFQPSLEIGEIASKVASEFTTMARELFATLQTISDEAAKWIAENQLEVAQW
jgi:hypothetical protein